MTADARTTFEHAASFFADLVRGLPSDRWDSPGLGVWSVKELTGHAARALSTVTEYLAAPAPSGPLLPDAVTYFDHVAGAGPELAAAIAERGREAGARLGDDPAASVATEVRRALDALAAHPDDRLVATRGGAMRLDAYLPTRTFELVVHGLDLTEAVGIEVEPPADALSSVLHICADLAVRRGLGGRLCLAATGRRNWPKGLSII